MTSTETKFVAVYCGGNDGHRPEYLEVARAFGGALAQNGLGLVFGGSNRGLMGAVALGALESGGDVIGVLPHALVATETPFPELRDLRLVDDMPTRKTLILRLADACVALPGGYGTLDELFEAVTLTQLGFARRPIWLLNTCGFYSGLVAFLDRASSDGLIREPHRDLIRLADEPIPLATEIAGVLRGD